jgi:hypothetical protein
LYAGEVPPPRAKNNLDRLERSINKLDPGRRHIIVSDWDLFLSVYREAG